MPALSVRLFGKFRAHCDAQSVSGLEAAKVQELFCYLLLHRGRPMSREGLAGLLWGDTSTAKSKKYLRQTLWHLQTTLNEHGGPDGESILRVEHDWVELNLNASVWLDVAVFEYACARAQGVPGRGLDEEGTESLHAAVQLYIGDLLEGLYHEWCLYERERLQNLYLSTLAKLLNYCLAQRRFERGLDYGAQILRYDRASERTHRQLMRLHCMAGDRTAALRQYERCVAALEEELGVRPDARTRALYEQIRADRYVSTGAYPASGDNPNGAANSVFLPGVLNRLKQIQRKLGEAQRQVRGEIKAIELDLKNLK